MMQRLEKETAPRTYAEDNNGKVHKCCFSKKLGYFSPQARQANPAQMQF